MQISGGDLAAIVVALGGIVATILQARRWAKGHAAKLALTHGVELKLAVDVGSEHRAELRSENVELRAENSGLRKERRSLEQTIRDLEDSLDDKEREILRLKKIV